MQEYIIGVDSGGTYTDAVVMDAATGSVVASAKSPTTHYSLSLGIGNVLRKVMEKGDVAPQSICMVSVSTTLATNALVEGNGADVGLFVIGYNQRLKVPAVAARYIPGGHDIKGNEEEPLGLEFIVDALKELHNKVDAWAICGQMAFKNPAHEKVAAHAISLTAKLPVFCSHEASAKAGMSERASTAVLNAQLLPVMQEFLQGVTEALTSLLIDAPVFVVRGDAQAMSMQEAERQAAATVASGPAATALFGAHQTHLYKKPSDNLSNKNLKNEQKIDALVLDVGGTTTDITLIKEGRPIIDTDGMVIGKWETHIEAVEMFTVGIGGDSHVALKKDANMRIGPKRVVPLCMASGLPSPETWIGTEANSRCIVPTPAAQAGMKKQDETSTAEEKLVNQSLFLNNSLAQEDVNTRLSKDQILFLDDPVLQFLLANGPATLSSIMKSLGLAELTINQHLQKLFRAQLVCEAGFTPTDALHVLGKLSIGDGKAATNAATALGALRHESAKKFSTAVLQNAEQKIEENVLQHVTRREVGGQLSTFLTSRSQQSLVQVQVALTVPMIGIGAAAQYLLPNVAKRLGTTVSFPERYDVGNALGAALMAQNCRRDSSTA